MNDISPKVVNDGPFIKALKKKKKEKDIEGLSKVWWWVFEAFVGS